jgi:hypothetical protein
MVVQPLQVEGNVYSVTQTTRIQRRAAHEMYGAMGYTLVSNYFLRDVLPELILRHHLTPLEVAVLSHVVGRQCDPELLLLRKELAKAGKPLRAGVVVFTQVDVAKELRVSRTSASTALSSLASINLVKRGQRSHYQLNPLIFFNGSGDVQKQLLEELRAMGFEDGFPDEIGPIETEKGN